MSIYTTMAVVLSNRRDRERRSCWESDDKVYERHVRVS